MRAKQGFTLMELGIVIGIMALLAAVAIPQFSGSQASAQRATAQDFLSQLNTAVSTWSTTYGRTPNSFLDFVTDGDLPAKPSSDPKNPNPIISTKTIGDKAPGCITAATTITCTAAFDKLSSVVYTLNGGTVTVVITN